MAKSTSPFRYFDSSPEVIRLVVMMYVKYPLSLRKVLSGQPREIERAPTLPKSGNRSCPSGIGFGTETAKGWSADQVTLGVEGVVNRRVGGEESLC